LCGISFVFPIPGPTSKTWKGLRAKELGWYGNLAVFFNTPWKINMEPTNHPFRKENDLPNLHDYVPC